jgi:excisionase family DNA binding protein
MNRLLTKTELASFLGISHNTLNLWVSRKKIPYLKLGDSRNSAVRFDPAEIKNWLVKKGSNKQKKSPDNG